ncbi:MAG: hypothetical protein ABFS03_04040 [Chloroflexota bacterium]
MTTNFDLVLLPIARQGGQNQSALPGTHIAIPPRRAARGRSLERVIIHLTLTGNAPLSPDGTEKITAHLEQAYYQTSGSSTAAMRSIAEWLNEYLLQRNQNAASRGMHAAGLLTLAVVRSNRLYIAQSGPGHAFLMTSQGEVQHFHRSEDEDRGLGIGRITHQHYYTADFASGDKLLISPQLPAGWTAAVFNEAHNLKMGELHQLLVRQGGDTINAALITTQPGKGGVRRLSPRPVGKDLDDASPISAVQPQSDTVPTLTSTPSEETQPVVMVDEPDFASIDRSLEATAATPAVDAPIEQPPSRPKRRRSAPILPGIGAFVRALMVTIRQAGKSSAGFIRRMLPDERLFSLPTTTLAFIAIAVPLVLTAIAAGAYFQRGQGRLYEAYMRDAQGAMAQAQQFEKENEKHIAWSAVVGYLDLAETYSVTEESQALRVFADAALDDLNRVTRIEFFPAVVADLPNSVEITRIVTTRDHDLYLLNGRDKTILRVVSTGQGFRLDKSFRCGPVPTLSGLIDIAAAPPNSQSIAVMGLDGGGNILQCIPGGGEPLNFPIPLFDHREQRAFVIDNGDLYLLTENAVWIYDGSAGFRNMPSGFFGDQIPSRIGETIDFAVRDDKLYLLHHDGTLTTAYLEENMLKEPDVFKNLPRSEIGLSTIPGATLAEMQWAAPPDSSLYFLDAGAHTIYRFSPQLVYQERYQPKNTLPNGKITAFTATIGHQFFVAMGNQLYYAVIP